MKAEEVSEFERLQAQLQSVYIEVGNLSKKKPDDALNEFKLGLIPYFCAKLAGFYSITQTGGISNQ